jgi:DNA invertase Pin-like site-specific DNA recombinase
MARTTKAKALPTQVIGYCRVSTEEQGDSGLGLKSQRSAINAECERRGWELVAVYEDVLSGRTLKRPGVAQALETVESGEA